MRAKKDQLDEVKQRKADLENKLSNKDNLLRQIEKRKQRIVKSHDEIQALKNRNAGY